MRIATVLCLAIFFSTPALAQTDAKTTFEQKCGMCHGADGKATTPMAKKMGAPDLTSAAVQGLSDAQIRTQITEGKGKMPPYGGILGKDGVEQMAKYVRTLGGAPQKKAAK